MTGVRPVHLCCVQPGSVGPDETLPRQSPRPVQDCVRCPPVGRGGEVWASGLRGDAARLADRGRESHRQQLRGLPRPGGQQGVLLRVQEEQRLLRPVTTGHLTQTLPGTGGRRGVPGGRQT